MKKKRKQKRRNPRWFTATELIEVWDRWQRGETAKDIGRVLDRAGQTIRGQLAVYGGIRPRVRCRAQHTLSLAEREEISRGIAVKRSAGRSRWDSIGHTRRSVGRSLATAAMISIGRQLRMSGRGNAHAVQNAVV